ncbi:MAG: ISAzo13 family transposase [Bdellovibrionota bacterium]
MTHETAGDPISGLKWTRRTTSKIAGELSLHGIHVSANTVARLLKSMGFSLRVNHKKKSNGSPTNRDAQFLYIADLRQKFSAQGYPIISVDAKKREHIGQFKNPGTSWEREAVRVNDHDYGSLARGIGIPYGIYDIQANWGAVYVGTTFDTSEFAVDSIGKWWTEDGSLRYPNTRELLILADGGGSNASSRRAWKYYLQQTLCNRHHLTVTVAHFPPGTSKWNPIEHRLFSEISKNWAGRPLDSYETIINYIRTTKTSTGLRVKSHLVQKQYMKGIRITDDQMQEICMSRNGSLPKWNYTIQPSEMR